MDEPLPLENKAILNVLNMLEGWIHIIGLRDVLHEEICHAVPALSGILWYNISYLHILAICVS